MKEKELNTVLPGNVISVRTIMLDKINLIVMLKITQVTKATVIILTRKFLRRLRKT